MWHEARIQEKKIRDKMVDHRKRAERRREHYENIKKGPAQFLQVHGQRSKIHIDQALAHAAEGSMIVWQGDVDNIIDRFDVRTHMDIIPEYLPSKPHSLTSEDVKEKERIDFERYRDIVLNDFLGVSEDTFLHQIKLKESFGVVGKRLEGEGTHLKEKKAAIGYVYQDSDYTLPLREKIKNVSFLEEIPDVKNQEDLSDFDLKEDFDVDVSQLTGDRKKELNHHGNKYGMLKMEYHLLQDKMEDERLQLAKEKEKEISMLSGRWAKKERRALRDKKLQKLTAHENRSGKSLRIQKSSSRSPTPEKNGITTFITSFGKDDRSGHDFQTVEEDSVSTRSSGKSSEFSKPKSSSSPRGMGPKLSDSLKSSRSLSGSFICSARTESFRDRKRCIRFSYSSSSEDDPLNSNSAKRMNNEKPIHSKNREININEKASKERDWEQHSKSLPKVSTPKMTPQEKLKWKMQNALNRHYNESKRAEREKKEKQIQEQRARENPHSNRYHEDSRNQHQASRNNNQTNIFSKNSSSKT